MCYSKETFSIRNGIIYPFCNYLEVSERFRRQCSVTVCDVPCQLTINICSLKKYLGNLARLGRNQRYECHLGIPRLASGIGKVGAVS